jgi:hypothetical protein
VRKSDAEAKFSPVSRGPSWPLVFLGPSQRHVLDTSHAGQQSNTPFRRCASLKMRMKVAVTIPM